jgi:hypothetical protein
MEFLEEMVLYSCYALQDALELRLKAVKNRMKRKEMHVELKRAKTKEKREARKRRKREIEELGDEVRATASI